MANHYRRLFLTPQPDRVTDRERTVGALVAEGIERTEIAERLDMPLGTVNKDLRLLYAKLCLGGRVDLARYAVRQGWVRAGTRGPKPKPR